jgi:hypothetical protein
MKDHEIVTTTLFGKPVRVLRRLKIAEVSGVDKGANPGAQIKLMKRDDTMPTADPGATAFHLWETYVALLAATGSLTKSEAYRAAQRSPLGQEMYALINGVSAATVLKGFPEGRARFPAARDQRHDGGGYTGEMYASTASEIDEDDAKSKFDKLVDDHMRANPGMSRDKARAAMTRSKQGELYLANQHRAELAAKMLPPRGNSI